MYYKISHVLYCVNSFLGCATLSSCRGDRNRSIPTTLRSDWSPSFASGWRRWPRTNSERRRRWRGSSFRRRERRGDRRRARKSLPEAFLTDDRRIDADPARAYDFSKGGSIAPRRRARPGFGSRDPARRRKAQDPGQHSPGTTWALFHPQALRRPRPWTPGPRRGAVRLKDSVAVQLTLDSAQLEELRARHGPELERWWEGKFGHSFDLLTQSEARYLARSKDADTIRDRIAAAEQAGNSGEASQEGRVETSYVSSAEIITGISERESDLAEELLDNGALGAASHRWSGPRPQGGTPQSRPCEACRAPAQGIRYGSHSATCVRPGW